MARRVSQKGTGVPRGVEEHFWPKVNVCGPDECWRWRGSLYYNGTGYFCVDGRLISAHRFSYELHKGRIPDGVRIHHLCGNKRCVNPDHLVAATGVWKFWNQVDKRGPDDCWNWTGYRQNRGYGGIQIDGKTYLAHRFSYEHHFGPISKGLFVCHECDNRRCQNPRHLWLGRNEDNVRDMIRKGRHKTTRAWEARPRGEQHGMAKLTWAKVNKMRDLYDRNVLSTTELGEMFRMDKSVIRNVIMNKAWKDPARVYRMQPRGLQNRSFRNSKLNRAQVDEIRGLYDRGVLSRMELTRRFGVSYGTVQAIVKRKSWK